MYSRFLKWFISVLIVGLVLLIAGNLVTRFSGGWLWTDWTGFGDYTDPNGEYQRGKTLWDWMELFLVPILLVLGAWWLDRSSKNNERKISDQRIEADKRLAADKRHQEILDTYLDRMSELMLKERLRTSDQDSQVRDIARARTLLALQAIDNNRKVLLLKFLYEAGLIGWVGEKPTIDDTIKEKELHPSIIPLDGVDLREIDLNGVKLNGINLTNTNLERANLFAADLQYANLSHANLDDANLGGAALFRTNLEYASLKRAYLKGAILISANAGNANFTEARAMQTLFMDADLNSAYFDGSLLSGANLSRANLSSASLIEANLLEYQVEYPPQKNLGKSKSYSLWGPATVAGYKVGPAIIDDADLSQAILKDAKISTKQLSRAKSLDQAYMPDSSIYVDQTNNNKS